MNKRIAEWYVKNKYKINIFIISITILAMINILLIYLSKKIEINKDKSSNELYKNELPIEYENKYNSIASKEESALTGEKIDESAKRQLEIIDEFIYYCKENKIDKAYELLSDECKQVFYPTLDIFKVSYYNSIFDTTDKNISVQNWYNNTYKIEILNNALSTGIYDENNVKQDYITIVSNKDNELKLNINGYMGRNNIDKIYNGNNIEIVVTKTEQYKDYQTYTFKVTNKTDKTILLDDKLNYDSMYLQDENEIKYTSYTHEISETDLMIMPRDTKEITIKYYNKYESTKQIKKIGFSGIQLNYNKNGKKNYESIVIDL